MFTDNQSLFFLTHFVLSFFLCTGSILLLSRFAKAKKMLLDSPTERKRHVGSIPMVGGLAIFLTFAFFTLLHGHSGALGALFLASLWLMFVGLADDIADLSSEFRLLAQITATLLIIYFGDAQIHTLGNLFTGEELRLNRISLMFTVMCVLGVINAINMIDGLDGLSSGITLLTVLSLLVVSVSSVSASVYLLMITMLGSLFAFFLFNMSYYGSSKKVFMGDAGSTVVGLLLAWLFIVLSQNGAQPLSSATAGWLFGLPLLDSVSVMLTRLKHGKSPFKADRNHLHHQLLAYGLSPRSTLILMLCAHAVMVSIGVLFNGVTGAEPFLFWAFVVLVLVRHFFFGWKLRQVA